MSLKTVLFDSLRALVADRVYPSVAPENVARPYIVYQQVGGSAINTLDPLLPNIKNARMQIAVWADSNAAASAMAASIEDELRLNPALHTSVLGAAVDIYEPDTALHGTRQDFSLWF